MDIPAWNADGILPPIDPNSPAGPNRSPYVVSLEALVQRFGSTDERRAILRGFLEYRSALHAAGLVRGFQWIDGSFLEYVEHIEARAPNDVDVVTFFRLPPQVSQAELSAQFPSLFAHDEVKTTYRVDSYFVHLAMQPEKLTERSAYWYSVWSHRRNRLWKGFVQVDLAPNEDATAIATLASLSNGAYP